MFLSFEVVGRIECSKVEAGDELVFVIDVPRLGVVLHFFDELVYQNSQNFVTPFYHLQKE